MNVGWTALEQGDLDAAEAAFTENGTPWGRQGLAYVSLERGQYIDALGLFQELVPAHFRERLRPRLARCFAGIGQIAAMQGRPVEAAVLLGAADAVDDDLGLAHKPRAPEQARLDVARSALGEAAWAREYGRGRALALEDAVSLALDYAGEP